MLANSRPCHHHASSLAATRLPKAGSALSLHDFEEDRVLLKSLAVDAANDAFVEIRFEFNLQRVAYHTVVKVDDGPNLLASYLPIKPDPHSLGTFHGVQNASFEVDNQQRFEMIRINNRIVHVGATVHDKHLVSWRLALVLLLLHLNIHL